MPVRNTIRIAAAQRFAAAMREEDRLEVARKRARELLYRAAFKDGFTRSKRGNLWRKVTVVTDARVTEVTVTVYRRDDGYHVCIADPQGPHFQPVVFDTEDDALEWLAGRFLGTAG